MVKQIDIHWILCESEYTYILRELEVDGVRSVDLESLKKLKGETSIRELVFLCVHEVDRNELQCYITWSGDDDQEKITQDEKFYVQWTVHCIVQQVHIQHGRTMYVLRIYFELFIR